jgi:two-component system, cell cycle sensor histidine kinase and response regulator CckA
MDRSHLEQVVMNLAVNARDAMPDGGTLTITTEVGEELGPEGRATRTARLRVADTGVGMTDDVKAKIFEPFFTTKGPDKGTGLGLATVFGIVQQAGGRIEVASEPGTGSCFHVHLPECRDAASRSTVVEIREATSRLVPGDGRSVLLVEDEDGVRKLARVVLESQGYAVAEVPDAEAALALVGAGQRVDLLLTDLTMPGIDGRELAVRVRAVWPGVAVVFMSGYVASADRLGEIPWAEFLPKPFTPTDLLGVAGRVLSPTTDDEVVAGMIASAPHDQ